MSTTRDSAGQAPPSFVTSSSTVPTDLAGLVYGRHTYEIMRYWDEDQPDWDTEERDFAVAWRSQPKWGRVAHVGVGRPQRHAGQG